MADDIEAELLGLGKEMDKDAEIDRKSHSHPILSPTVTIGA
jgi:hypothetical protein